MANNTRNKINRGWHFIAQVDLGDLLTLADVRNTYLQNYIDKGFTDVKFETVGQNKYKVYLKKTRSLSNLDKKSPIFQAAILPIKIKLLKPQIKEFPDKKKEINNEIVFWQIALKNYQQKRKLSEWEMGLPDELRLKLRNRKYLPSQAEVNRIPYKQRESYQEEFFDYEIWNREYINALAKQIGHDKVVLEVGAGSGRLSYFLRKKLPNNQITAIDISLKNKVSGIPLVKMSMKQALQKYSPDIILCSWPDEFFWKEIKYNTSARKIILIGDSEDTPLAKEVKGEWQWLPIKGFKVKEFLAAKKVQTSRDSLGTTLIYTNR
ncbi:MAG: class I SAM-dependent methyltransferase [Candidatus Parcubacteria bacterium]|nr:class I SAM-dependent methyltransferase [Candidatus Parcubacteria bacterium]